MAEVYDGEERERDKDRARLIASGELPDNIEIESVMQRSQKVALDVERSGELSGTGQKIAQDTRTFLGATLDVITEKNRGEELQKIAEAIKKAGIAANEAVMDTLDQPAVEESQARLEDLLNVLKTLVWSPGFRRALRDLNTLILESFAGSEASSERSKAGPSSNTEVFQEISQEEEKSTDNERAVGNKERGLETTTSVPSGEQVSEMEDLVEEEMEFQSDFSKHKEDRSKIFADEGLTPQRDTEHTRNDFKIVFGRKEFGFLDQEITPENTETIADAAQRLFGDVSSDKTTAESFKELFRLISYMVKFSKQNTFQGALKFPESVKIHQDEAWNHAQSLLENMASFHELNTLKTLVTDLVEQVKQDSQLSSDAETMMAFFYESLDNHDEVMTDSWSEKSVDCINCVRKHLHRYRLRFFLFIQELDSFLVDLRDDKALQRFSHATRRLGADIFCDKEGRLRYKPEALAQMAKIFVPMFEQSFSYIALPTISGKDSSMEYEIRNMVLRTKGLTPNEIEIQNDNHAVLGQTIVKDGESAFGGVTSLHIAIRGITTVAEDVEVSYQRLTFPKISDSGKLTVNLSKEMDIEIWLSGDSQDEKLFHPDRVECNIRKLSFSGIEFDKHEFLFKVLKPIIQIVVRGKAEKTVEENIMKSLFRLEEMAREEFHQSQDCDEPLIHESGHEGTSLKGDQDVSR